MSDWNTTQLTFGSSEQRFHAHSYYDIPVIDGQDRRVLAHCMHFAGRHPTGDDRVDIGLVELASPGSWRQIGKSRAWSWQQGPMAQWVAGGPWLVFNDREAGGRDGDRFVARLLNADSGEARTLPRAVYAVDGHGTFALSLNLARLETLRPGYGYADGAYAGLAARAPSADGIWRLQLDGSRLDGSRETLLLSLERAVAFLLERLPLRQRWRHRLARFHYWFNHIKISPDGCRFTVKLRWRRRGQPWNNRMGVSLTAAVDGTDLRLLADATSHVIWLNAQEAYFWRAGELALFADTSPTGRRVRAIAPGLVDQNVHFRHVPPHAARTLGQAVFDTPYQKTVRVVQYEDTTGAHRTIARFANHVPARGPFRCDLHPVPTSDGRHLVVTSLQDGGRQIYRLSQG